MKTSIEFDTLKREYIDEALELVLSSYCEEREEMPYLPESEDFRSKLKHSIGELFGCGSGAVVLVNGKVAGFIAGFEVMELFGKCRGIYWPLYGHGAVKELRGALYNELYRHAAKLWVERSCTSHAVTLFAHDRETIDTWFWMGFGLRCIDAAREVLPIGLEGNDIIVKKVDKKDIPYLSEIHGKHDLYYKNSPMFMHRKGYDPVKDLEESLSEKDHHMWAAYFGGKPMGYMRIEPEAESFVSEHESIMNITGAYVANDMRKTGVGTALLSTIQQWLLDNNYPVCGVDFESINTLGSSFWMKYFTPYTYSVVRRIDERVL